jgi:hypothetical protein
MNYFDQFIQYRALAFKFSSEGQSLGDVERSIAAGSVGQAVDGTFVPFKKLEEVYPVKNVCAKLHVSLVDRLDQALSVLEMSKRDFIEIALIEALNKVDQVLADTDAFENIDRRQAEAERLHDEAQSEAK